LLIVSCGPVKKESVEYVKDTEVAKQKSSEVTQKQDVVTAAEDNEAPHMDIKEPEVMYSVESPSSAPILDQKDFKVALSVDSIMYLGQSGTMQVWIGSEDVEVSFSKGMIQDETVMSSSIGKYARITPFAPDFEITPVSTNICHKIDPGGSEVRFGLVPKDEGRYSVSANIDLFDTEDCTGISVPKTARVLSVSVGVDMKKEISKKVHELESVAWDKFKLFWIALMTLIFGAAIFVARKFIKKKTGYEEGPPTS